MLIMIAPHLFPSFHQNSDFILRWEVREHSVGRYAQNEIFIHIVRRKFGPGMHAHLAHSSGSEMSPQLHCGYFITPVGSPASRAASAGIFPLMADGPLAAVSTRHANVYLLPRSLGTIKYK